MRFLSIFVTLTLLASATASRAHANFGEEQAVQNSWLIKFRNQSDRILSILRKANAESVQTKKTQTCDRAYDELYRNEAIQITIAIGYNDSRPGRYVEDRALEKTILQTLQYPCSSNELVCGFQWAGKESFTTHLYKEVIIPDRGVRKLRVEIFSSAIGINDDENRTNSSQERKSAHAREKFFNAISRSQIVFYLGHARDGGGPDFDPPILLDSLHPDYNGYRKASRDFNDLIERLQAAGSSRPALLALLGCSTQKHFAQKITQVAPEMGLLLSKRSIDASEFFEGLYTSLNGIQRQSCGDELNRELEAVNVGAPAESRRQTLLLFRRFP